MSPGAVPLLPPNRAPGHAAKAVLASLGPSGCRKTGRIRCFGGKTCMRMQSLPAMDSQMPHPTQFPEATTSSND
eukprot:CAMPEP_0115511634 /NCGR_PEP_ID=MMETSP0271-20121206/74076_1 /TAXON_ID=71861 /ORGANISM="Scrippsiella trochoidea, Strain CCMP3099" /LENGTH=73 /DNA_ID=CAMNT_0002941729 /DNA_START=71 /DNA_END=292 /DNA_ORIENTATION=-